MRTLVSVTVLALLFFALAINTALERLNNILDSGVSAPTATTLMVVRALIFVLVIPLLWGVWTAINRKSRQR